MSAQVDQRIIWFLPRDILVDQCLNIIRDVMLTQTGFRFAAFLYRWSLSDVNDNTVQGDVPVRDISNTDSTDLRHRVTEPAGQETRQLDFRIFNDFQHGFCRNKIFNFLRYLRQPYIIVIVRIKIVYNTSYVAVSVSNSLG